MTEKSLVERCTEEDGKFRFRILGEYYCIFKKTLDCPYQTDDRAIRPQGRKIYYYGCDYRK